MFILEEIAQKELYLSHCLLAQQQRRPVKKLHP